MKKQIPIPMDNSIRYLILSLIAMCGEFPVDQMPRLTGGERYKMNLIKELKKQKMIHTYYAAKYRAFRLSKNGKALLLEKNPDRFQFWLTGDNDTNHLKSEITRRIRLRRIAETTVTMINAGVHVYRDEKPNVFTPIPLSTALQIDEPIFFNSREIKSIGQEAVKISGARSVGVLLSADDLFVVYNLGGSLMKWSHNAEMRTKVFLMNNCCLQRQYGLYLPNKGKAILLANDIETAYKLLTVATNTLYAIDEDCYEHFFYLTNDRKGERLIQLLCDRYLNEQLNEILKTDLCEHNPSSAIENDAFTEDGLPVLFAHTFDWPRIKRFKRSLEIYDMEGVVVCFDYQKEVLEQYLGERVRFETISFEKWEKAFFG